MKTIAEIRLDRLAELIREHGTQAAFAEAIGKATSQVSQWVNRSRNSGTGKPRKMSDEVAREIEKKLGKPTGWMDQPHLATEPPQAINLTNNPDYPAVRRVTFKLSAGASGFSVAYDDDDCGAPIVFQRAWFERSGYRPERLFATRVSNGSMEPGLYDGDTVIVNTDQTTPRDGHVFAVNYEGELVIKRMIRDAGQWWLSSDNPDQRRYPRKACHEGVSLIGEIVHKQSERI